jgi:hypothetical protein
MLVADQILVWERGRKILVFLPLSLSPPHPLELEKSICIQP